MLDGLRSLRPFASALSLPCAATQLVTMHDLKQGLGPSGIAGPRKLASNKYKLKVGVPEPKEGSPPAGVEAVGRVGIVGGTGNGLVEVVLCLPALGPSRN